MATKKYELLSDAMWLNDREHHKGDTVELDTERGEELVELGAVRDPSSKTAASSEPTDESADEESSTASARSTKTGTRKA